VSVFLSWPAAPATSQATRIYHGGAIGLSAPTSLAVPSRPKAVVASVVASSPKADLRAGRREVPLLSLPVLYAGEILSSFNDNSKIMPPLR
jgi:hypothetical protein